MVILIAIFLKLLILVLVGFSFAYFIEKYSSRPPSYKDGQHVLKPSPFSKFLFAFVWLATMGFAIIIYLASEMDGLNSKFIGSCLGIAIILSVVMFPSVTMKVLYDEEKLSVKIFAFSWIYKWENLKRVREYYSSTSGVLILKFNKRLSIGIPTDFIGFNHFENFVYRQSHNI